MLCSRPWKYCKKYRIISCLIVNSITTFQDNSSKWITDIFLLVLIHPNGTLHVPLSFGISMKGVYDRIAHCPASSDIAFYFCKTAPHHLHCSCVLFNIFDTKAIQLICMKENFNNSLYNTKRICEFYNCFYSNCLVPRTILYLYVVKLFLLQRLQRQSGSVLHRK